MITTKLCDICNQTPDEDGSLLSGTQTKQMVKKFKGHTYKELLKDICGTQTNTTGEDN